jgi:phosphoribosylformylglycinamidine synthase PurS subunit
MKFRAEIDVMPHDNLLDPQGKAVSNNMVNVGLPEIENVRIGRHIRLEVEANNREEAESKVQEACKRILANEIMESYSFELSEA